MPHVTTLASNILAARKRTSSEKDGAPPRLCTLLSPPKRASPSDATLLSKLDRKCRQVETMVILLTSSPQRCCHICGQICHASEIARLQFRQFFSARAAVASRALQTCRGDKVYPLLLSLSNDPSPAAVAIAAGAMLMI